MTVTIYHNPRCSNSRRCLEIIRERGIEPDIVEYLVHPLKEADLDVLFRQMNVEPIQIVRSKEPLYAQLSLGSVSREQLLAAIAANPVLMNRPIVVSGKGARLCRPPELVESLL